MKNKELNNNLRSNFTVIDCDKIQEQEKHRERTVNDIPHKCKFCGQEMRLFTPETLNNMTDEVKAELGLYTCNCEGYHKYFTTLLQERKAQLEFQKQMYLINKARQELFLNSSFYRDAVKLSQIRAKAQEKIDEISNTQSKKEKFNQLDKYFNSATEFNEGRGKILDYYFWPMFENNGGSNENNEAT